MAHGRSTTMMSMIQWTRTSRLSKKISLYVSHLTQAGPSGRGLLVGLLERRGRVLDNECRLSVLGGSCTTNLDAGVGGTIEK